MAIRHSILNGNKKVSTCKSWAYEQDTNHNTPLYWASTDCDVRPPFLNQYQSSLYNRQVRYCTFLYTEEFQSKTVFHPNDISGATLIMRLVYPEMAQNSKGVQSLPRAKRHFSYGWHWKNSLPRKLCRGPNKLEASGKLLKLINSAKLNFYWAW